MRRGRYRCVFLGGPLQRTPKELTMYPYKGKLVEVKVPKSNDVLVYRVVRLPSTTDQCVTLRYIRTTTPYFDAMSRRLPGGMTQ